MNTRKHFSGNQSLIRWPGSGITMSIITHVNSSLLPLETEGGKYIVKIYNSFQTLGNKFQQGLFQLQHKKRIRLTSKHVSGSQSVRKLTMIQIILTITQNKTIFQKSVTDLQESTNDRVTEHWTEHYWALNTPIILNDAMTAHCWDCSKLDRHEIQVIWDLYSCAVSSCEHPVRSVT